MNVVYAPERRYHDMHRSSELISDARLDGGVHKQKAARTQEALPVRHFDTRAHQTTLKTLAGT